MGKLVCLPPCTVVGSWTTQSTCESCEAQSCSEWKVFVGPGIESWVEIDFPGSSPCCPLGIEFSFKPTKPPFAVCLKWFKLSAVSAASFPQRALRPMRVPQEAFWRNALLFRSCVSGGRVSETEAQRCGYAGAFGESKRTT